MRAKQGDHRAIEELLNTSLQAHQITARTRVKHNTNTLLVVLEASQEPDQLTSIEILKQCLQPISSTQFTTVEIYARKLGDSFPAWVEKLPLGSSAPQTTRSGQGPGSRRQGYEFSERQNQILSQFVQKSRQVSYFMMGIGVLLMMPAFMFLFSGAADQVQGGLLALAPGLMQAFLPGVIFLVDGFSKYRVSHKIQLIVETEGQDIDLLMEAIGTLDKTNGILTWVFIACLIGVAMMVGLFIPLVLSL